MSMRGKVWVFILIPALVAFWAIIIRVAATLGGRIMGVVR